MTVAVEVSGNRLVVHAVNVGRVRGGEARLRADRVPELVLSGTSPNVPSKFPTIGANGPPDGTENQFNLV